MSITINKNGKNFIVECIIFQDMSFEISINDVTQEEEQIRLKRQLTQNIAHELKTPVSSIQGYLETIVNNENIAPEKMQVFLERCYAQSNRLSRLLQFATTLHRPGSILLGPHSAFERGARFAERNVRACEALACRLGLRNRILRFALARGKALRGVHFQPVSYFGRIPELPADDDRYTLDELLEAVVSQSGGLIKEEQIAPSCCDHPMCGFHGDFIVMPGDKLMPLTNYSGKTEAEPEGEGCCCGPDPAEKNREFVGRRWERRDLEETCCCGESQPEKESCCCDANADAYLLEKAQPEPGSCCCGETQPEPESCCCEEESVDITNMEDFLKRAKSHGFTITSMAFQDAGNLDIERLRQCSLHVYKDGRMVPFCSYYLTPFGE